MAGKWSVKNPLTLEERIRIKEGLDANLYYYQIAICIGRGKTTIIKESHRLGDIENYDPHAAQKHFENLQKLSRKKISETLKKKYDSTT